jgi:hypothetical protein
MPLPFPLAFAFPLPSAVPARHLFAPIAFPARRALLAALCAAAIAARHRCSAPLARGSGARCAIGARGCVCAAPAAAAAEPGTVALEVWPATGEAALPAAAARSATAAARSGARGAEARIAVLRARRVLVGEVAVRGSATELATCCARGTHVYLLRPRLPKSRTCSTAGRLDLSTVPSVASVKSCFLRMSMSCRRRDQHRPHRPCTHDAPGRRHPCGSTSA